MDLNLGGGGRNRNVRKKKLAADKDEEMMEGR